MESASPWIAEPATVRRRARREPRFYTKRRSSQPAATRWSFCRFPYNLLSASVQILVLNLTGFPIGRVRERAVQASGNRPGFGRLRRLRDDRPAPGSADTGDGMREAMRNLVVIPTYNERENIDPIVRQSSSIRASR
jgi:hypothetical protein